ncbi:hypothetical protein ACLB2K_032934 [Fragaria x ananassa]
MALEILIESLQTHDDCMVLLEGLVDRSSGSELIGVIWDSWTLKSKHVSVTCDWSKGVKGDSKTEIMAGFREDVEGNSLTPVAPEPSYSYEKLVTWAAMLALITDEVGCEILEFWYAVLDIWWSSKDDAVIPLKHGSDHSAEKSSFFPRSATPSSLTTQAKEHPREDHNLEQQFACEMDFAQNYEITPHRRGEVTLRVGDFTKKVRRTGSRRRLREQAKGGVRVHHIYR